MINMAFPICDECAKSGVLCEKCQKRTRDGEVSELDVLLSSILAQHGAPGYDLITDLETKLVIFASDRDAHSIIGPEGKTAEELSKKLGRRVIVIVKSWDKEQIVRSLARPSRLVTRNTVFRPGGKEVLKFIFDKPIDEGSLKLIKELAGDIEIEIQKRDFIKLPKKR